MGEGTAPVEEVKCKVDVLEEAVSR